MSFSSTSCWCQGAIFLKKGSCFASHPYDLKTAIQPTNYNIKEPSYFCETQNHEHQMFTPSEDQSAVRQYYEQSSNDFTEGAGSIYTIAIMSKKLKRFGFVGATNAMMIGRFGTPTTQTVLQYEAATAPKTNNNNILVFSDIG
ncbi:hypothetical protein QR680_003563 [Steinernema hermaphroditum]|uniref:Uncharacterized protein n=1 Tax=Steinernema hermaphroditum TaxID=289476 RepID=A0AA39HN17_9BILA|nr:hypothetical protein QR680_003563 [Steinernema hermaphroditum]